MATTGTTASINYTVPTSDGGSPISGYQHSLDGGVTWSSTQAVSNPLPVSGLTPDTPYQFAIRAVNANGPGATSNIVLATTGPAAPTITSVTTGPTTASINYTASGSPVTGYQYSLDGGFSWSSTQSIQNPLPVSGLTSGTTYQFAIREVNDNGVGATSNIVAATTDGSQVFDVSGTFTAPAGVTSVSVSVWGGGGRGAPGNTGTSNGTPGAGAAEVAADSAATRQSR